jgi:hypothetical protein
LSRNQIVVWLQRSRMFIETGCVHDPRSRGAQCFRRWPKSRVCCFAPLEREESFAARVFYKH